MSEAEMHALVNWKPPLTRWPMEWYSTDAHGPGLSEQELQRIWERFYRAPGIEVRSGTGVGSTFWFKLPLAA